MTPDLLAFVRALSGGGVDYIIVGGVAAGIHGALRTTLDLDVVYGRDPDNVARLVAAPEADATKLSSRRLTSSSSKGSGAWWCPW